MRTIALLLLSLPLYGAGALQFNGVVGEYVICEPVTILADNCELSGLDLQKVSMMAWVTPGFSSSAGGNPQILNNGVTLSGTGFTMRYAGSVGFRMGFGAGVIGGIPIFRVCDAKITFDAGDLIGIYAEEQYDHVTSQIACEAVNITQGLNSVNTCEAGGSCGNSWTLHNSTIGLAIGSSSEGSGGLGTNPWVGKIHQIVLTGGLAKNSEHHQMNGPRKFRFWPQWTGTYCNNGEGGYSAASLDVVFNFEDGNVGETPLVVTAETTQVQQCEVHGAPLAVASEMMR